MTSRETQKLHQTLNAAFQKQLDSEHPTGQNNESHYATSHVQSILGSPLFHKSPLQRQMEYLGRPQDREVPENLSRWLERPLEQFEHAVSDGTASLEMARLCLAIQFKKKSVEMARLCLANQPTQDSSPPTSIGAVPAFTNTMLTPGTGKVILNWLWSSGLERSGGHLKDLEFIGLLTCVLVIEQRYEPIYQWLCRLQAENISHEPTGNKEQDATQAYIIFQLVHAEADHGAGLDAAMVHFLQYFERYSNPSQRRRIFYPAGKQLSFAFANPPKHKEPWSKTMDSFVKSTPDWTHGPFIVAWQDVYHPKDPRPDKSMQYLQSLSANQVAKLNKSSRNRLIQMALKTADIYLARNDEARATKVMQLVHTHFGGSLGVMDAPPSTSSPTPSMDGEEADNLKLLEGLAVT